jgi:WD40 repeat protein
MLWEWNVSTNAVECIHVCRGHERALECVGVSSCKSRMATGGWDTHLKIWSAGKVLYSSHVIYHPVILHVCIVGRKL